MSGTRHLAAILLDPQWAMLLMRKWPFQTG